MATEGVLEDEKATISFEEIAKSYDVLRTTLPGGHDEYFIVMSRRTLYDLIAQDAAFFSYGRLAVSTEIPMICGMKVRLDKQLAHGVFYLERHIADD
jgi:hypothetical protein